ncbi:hypothetical protein SAMN04488113_1065 [Alkalibacterium gilvum]|uniref:Uncharacterized protein n=1 Tax=Alkalibacterium gilvum TaxID=1130080 RepID=A0A1H6SFR5_9LACT|nr:hypothetical protein [Alkalibacterium gilvum]SEI62282.1 hypothetical protein SAMN04488113_1065 [Alkalibacterium gilvum]
MSKKAFHIYNIIIFLLLLAFNSLALFGAIISEGDVYSYIWLTTGLSFVFWVIFYIVQFLRSDKVWRISWFIIMVVLLFFWQTGLGASLSKMIF